RRTQRVSLFLRDRGLELGPRTDRASSERSLVVQQAKHVVREGVERPNQRAGDAVRAIVVRVRHVVDAVTAASPHSPFEPEALVDEPLVLQKLDAPGVDEQQKLQIKFRTVFIRDAVLDGVSVELLSQELARELIAFDLAAAVLP